MNEARWQSFFNTMVKAEIFQPDINYKDAFTLQFVKKK